MRLIWVCLFGMVVNAALAEDSNLILTVGNETYSNVTFDAVTATSVKIHHAAGVARLPLAKLPLDLQQRFGYPPKKTNDVIVTEFMTLSNRVDTARVAAVEAPGTNQPPLGSLGYLDWRNGFRDLMFGQTLETCTGMLVTPADGTDNLMLTRREDNLLLGEAKLKQVQYSFYKRKLVAVVVQIEGDENVTNALRVLKHAYGEGTTGTNGAVQWLGERVQAELNPLKDKHGSAFLIGSRALSQEQRDGNKAREEAERKAKLEEAAKGL